MGIKLDPRAGFRKWLHATFGGIMPRPAKPKREPKPAKPMKQWRLLIVSSSRLVRRLCHAHTRSEARAQFKRMVGGRLPLHANIIGYDPAA